MELVRLALPQDEFAGFVEAHPPVCRQAEQVGLVNRLKGRMPFQEVGNAVADRGSVHAEIIVTTSGAGLQFLAGDVPLRHLLHSSETRDMDDHFGLLWIHVGFGAIVALIMVLFLFN
jgi:hypothetical protein